LRLRFAHVRDERQHRFGVGREARVMYFICCTCPRVRPVRIETVTFFLPSHALGKADKVARRSRLLDIMSLVVTVVAALTYLASLLFDPAASLSEGSSASR
jgi:hypothetical protein